MRALVRTLVVAALAALLPSLSAAQAGAQAEPTPEVPVLYVSTPAAKAIADGTSSLPGFPGSRRQGPVFPEDWPAPLVLGKLSGAALSRMDAGGMAAAIAAELRRTPAGVGVDELLPRDWTAAANRNLAAALRRIGPDAASRVVLYVSPAFVSRIGSIDPSRRLPTQLATLVQALRAGATAMLEFYRPGTGVLRRQEYERYPTRWLARFPGASRDRLRIMFGPDGGLGQSAIWRWTRSTPAGRRILANGPGAYGLRTEAEGRDWLIAYADFLAEPHTSPTGRDVVVPRIGGLKLQQAGPRRLRLSSSLRYRIVIQLLPRDGGRRRVIGPYHGPLRGRLITVPRTLAAGRYLALATGLGEGLREQVRAAVRFGPPPR